VRRNAVEIAKDILRKLKLTIGDMDVLDGLKMKPSDDMATLGAIKGVATVYERLLAWARNNNDSAIFQHPSVIAATQAIGQLGYLAKREALRMAELAGNKVMASNIAEQIKKLPDAYIPKKGTTFGNLLDTVQSGIDTVLNRTQQVSVNGGKVGYSVDSTLGSSMSANPTAGMAYQGAVQAAQRNAQVAQADQLAATAQAQRINSQMAAQARTSQAATGQTQAPQPAPRGSSVGRQALGSAKAQQQQAASVSTSKVTATTPLTPAQQMAAQRNATSANLARSAREHEEQLHHEQQIQQQNILNQQRANAAKVKTAAQKIDPNMLKGFKSATNLSGVTGPVVTGGRPIDPKSIQATVGKQATAPAPGAIQGTPIKPPTPGVDDPIYPPQPGMPPRGTGRGF
jgi:hypothetical protein